MGKRDEGEVCVIRTSPPGNAPKYRKVEDGTKLVVKRDEGPTFDDVLPNGNGIVTPNLDQVGNVKDEEPIVTVGDGSTKQTVSTKKQTMEERVKDLVQEVGSWEVGKEIIRLATENNREVLIDYVRGRGDKNFGG